jgi:hypothetical protein
MMQVFKTRPDGFREVQRKVIPRMIGIFGGLFLLAVVVPGLFGRGQTRWDLIAILFLMFAVVMGFVSRAAIRRQRRSFETYRLTVDDEKLVREQFNTPVITIFKRDIVRIIRNADGGFTVFGENELDAIGIPSQVDRYAQLEKELQRIRTVQVKTTASVEEKIFVPLSLSGGLFIAITSMTANKTVELVCSFLIVLLMGAGMVIILMTKNIDKRTKRLSWIFVIPIIAYLANIFSLLSE